MNSLHKLSVYCKMAVFALMIISCLTIAASAQTVQPQQQGKMYGDPGFRGEPINLNVVNADIRDILNYITEQYGINFVIDKSVDKVPVTVNVNEVPWNVALDSILQAQELGVQVNGSILRVAQAKNLAAEGEVRRQRQENQLDTSPLYTEFIRLNYAFGNGSLAQQSGGAGAFVGGVSSSSVGNTVGSSSGNDQGILGIVKRRLSRRGAVEVDSRSNTLIITDVRENIDAIRQLVSLLDQPEPQVEIEARIVIATRSFSRDLGVALSALVLGPRGSGASGSTLPGSQVQSGSGGTGGSGGGSGPGFVPNGIPNGIGAQPNNSLLSSIPNTVIGLTTGIFGTAQISALITAGESKGQAKTIATPRVTTLNNRPAQIESGAQIPITTIQPGSGTGQAAVATTEYVNVPLRLAVTPQITDAGTVILNVVAENNTAQAGGVISTQRMQTQVMVPDGGTTVVGGALLDSEREEQNRTPGLSKVPLLGNLFKRKGVFRDSQEILFFITPRVYRPDFEGNPTSSKRGNGTNSTTLIQPVPLGNPSSNSETVPVVPVNQAPVVPAVVQTQANPAASSKP
ncbi:MAG: Type pilus secretin PilQ/competence protein [Acidobacteria bacterium]|jgi:type IV pilus assembly protein PilQ|nr:Type pilus secretin PilQ/competence protein [Acidobacteriota bacterium]